MTCQIGLGPLVYEILGMKRKREFECSQQFGEKNVEMRSNMKTKVDIIFQNLRNLDTNAFLDFVGTFWTWPDLFLTECFTKVLRSLIWALLSLNAETIESM